MSSTGTTGTCWPDHPGLGGRLERLRVDAEDCALISKLATDRAKREVFDRLAAQIRLMIVEVEAAIDARIAASKM